MNIYNIRNKRVNFKWFILPCFGTKYYMAPEVINEEEIEVKDLEKVDLFSLGVMLYNLAFYSYPYEHINEQKEDNKKIEEKINYIISEKKFRYSIYYNFD